MHVNFLTCGLIVRYNIHFVIIIMDFSIQESWQEFGIDFEEPVPLDEDENAVVVEELPHFLSQEEMTTLRQHISQPASMNDEWMIHSYAVTRSIIHSLSDSQ